MKRLRCIGGKFCYGSMPINKTSMRAVIRKIAKRRINQQLARQVKAFHIISNNQGW
ncbi:hypothetical protein [Rouxiella sp. S1S-2]|uniref:hypothetical protein n=1 Tax=Rouxiella sp. S1S-2 TaxID=2653856 RepID=UPI000A73B27E|nr:hypothetical protein [Rouxiella sp. S1S-2]